MDTWRTDWVNKKKDIAVRLNRGECGGSYGEAVLILCPALSALAAEVWPGQGVDRKRFVELPKDFALPTLGTTKISIPLLIGSLRSAGKKAELATIKKTFLDYNSALVVTGDEVDKTENDILTVCSALSLKELREYSYANLLYREIRSGYAHEYRPGKNAASHAMTMKANVHVSYINWVDKPDRDIHFHLEWIAEVATCVAQAVDARAKSLPLQNPSKWWLDG